MSHGGRGNLSFAANRAGSLFALNVGGDTIQAGLGCQGKGAGDIVEIGDREDLKILQATGVRAIERRDV